VDSEVSLLLLRSCREASSGPSSSKQAAQKVVGVVQVRATTAVGALVTRPSRSQNAASMANSSHSCLHEQGQQ